jgi:hypothetical protein
MMRGRLNETRRREDGAGPATTGPEKHSRATSKSRTEYIFQLYGENTILDPEEIFMTAPMPLHTTSIVPTPQLSINDNLPTSSPSPKSTLIGLACILGVITLFVMYWNIIGF